MKPIELGTGRLSWRSTERITDRYGAIFLLENGDSTSAGVETARLTIPEKLIGTYGKLVAEVLETRLSTHVGDWFHGIYPRTPKVGQRIVLGKGQLFTENPPHVSEVPLVVGVKPLPERDTQWMKMRALYDVHEQTVRLVFEPEEN